MLKRLLGFFSHDPAIDLGTANDRIIPPQTPYVDVKYSQALALSTAYQGGVVAWVAFWALYGAGGDSGA